MLVINKDKKIKDPKVYSSKILNIIVNMLRVKGINGDAVFTILQIRFRPFVRYFSGFIIFRKVPESLLTRF